MPRKATISMREMGAAQAARHKQSASRSNRPVMRRSQRGCAVACRAKYGKLLVRWSFSSTWISQAEASTCQRSMP